MAFNFKTIFSTAGAEKLKAAFAGALEPALIFASTGSKAQALWGGMKAIIVNSLLGPLALLSGATLGVVGAIKAVIANTEMLRKGMEKLKKVEFTEAQFKGLLGGVQLAKERVEELYEFANSTPFQMAGVAEASRLLQVLTKGALATTENLKMIGDAAATAGADFANVSLHVGRMYDGLQSGRPVGESAARLQELGLMSGQARAKIEAMTKAGNSFSEVWRVVEVELKKNEGGMKTLSETIVGLETTLADAQDKMQAGFAKGFMESEKLSLERAREMAIALQKPLEKLGEIFGAIAKVGNKIAGVFLYVTGGAQGLSKAINFLIEAFLVMGTMIMTKQLLHLVGTLILARGNFLATAKATYFFKTAQEATQKGTMAMIASLKGQSLMLKITGASAIAAGKAYQLAKMFVIGFTKSIIASFQALLANPILAVIAALAALGVAIYRVAAAREAEAKAGAEAREATKELTDSYKDQMRAVDSMAAKTQLLNSMYEKVKSSAKEAGEAQGEIDAGFFTDEGAAKADAMKDRVYALIYQMQQLMSIDESRLRVSEARLGLMQKELDLAKQLRKQGFEQEMASANEAEKVVLMIQERNRLKDIIKESAKTQENSAAAAEFQEREAVRVAYEKANIEADLNIKLGLRQKMQNRMLAGDSKEDVIEDFLRTDAGKKRVAEAKESGKFDRSFINRYMQAVATGATGGLYTLGKMASSQSEDTGLEKFDTDAFIDFLANDRMFTEEGARDIEKQRMEALKKVDDDSLRRRIEETGMVGIKDGVNLRGENLGDQENIDFSGQGRLGRVAAIESTLQAAAAELEIEGKKFKLTQLQKQALENVKKQLVENSKEHNNNVLEVEKLNNRIEVTRDNLMHAANVRIINTNEIEALRKVTKETMEAEREKLNIQKKANQERIDAFEKSFASGGGQSTERTRKEITEMKERLEEIRGNPEMAKEFVRLQADIMEAEGALKDFETAQKDTAGFIDNIKKQEDALAKLERQAIKTFNRLKEDLKILAASNEVDFRFDIGDLSGAMDMLEELGNMEDAKFLERRTEELAKKMTEKDAAAIASRELAEKKRAQSEEVQGNAAKARRAQDLAELQLAARMGDPAAKRKATAMEDRTFIEEAFRKNLGDSKDPMDISMAKSAALSELMTKKLGEVPEIKTVADSFRSIGAGGAATSTDPQIILARKRTEALTALAKLTQEMKGIQLDTKEVIDNRLNFDVR